MILSSHEGANHVEPERADKNERREVLELATSLYACYNHTYLHEVLVAEEGIRLGRRSVSRILTEGGLRSPRKRRARRHRARRERMPREAMMLQVDGSNHDWLEGRGPRGCPRRRCRRRNRRVGSRPPQGA